MLGLKTPSVTYQASGIPYMRCMQRVMIIPKIRTLN